MRTLGFVVVTVGFCAELLGCTHQPMATVLPRPSGRYEVIGQADSEQGAYSNAEEEAKYTCEERHRRLVVLDQKSLYQGADKNAKGDVKAENVALAFFTGSSGKERNVDDYKVTLTVQCE